MDGLSVQEMLHICQAREYFADAGSHGKPERLSMRFQLLRSHLRDVHINQMLQLHTGEFIFIN